MRAATHGARRVLMTKSHGPRVSIGLPVYNGENFLEEAIVSLLAQSFEDFELIIADNASTDNTEAICQTYASRDKRIRYVRSKENIGAARNFNLTFTLATGEYFKWAAHDDVCRADFLARCVDVLDRDPAVVLCFTRSITIDDQSRPLNERPPRPDWSANEPHVRFRQALALEETMPVFGLIRSDTLRRTPLIGSYPASDRPLLAHLGLHGRFVETPEILFCHRQHGQRSVQVYDWRDPHRAVTWYAPEREGALQFPEWRLFAEYWAAICRSPVNWQERIRCSRHLAGWVIENRHGMLRDLNIAAGRMTLLGPVWIKWLNASKARKHARHVRNRSEQIRKAKEELPRVIPEGHTFILVDDAESGMQGCDRRPALPFLEREGRFWGRPCDDEAAIGELERMRRQSRASFIVFDKPARWWLDYYAQFHHYLRSHFPCVLENSRLIIFDLRTDHTKDT